MATIPASENVFPILRFDEGAAPSTPPTGEVHLYAKSDGLLYWKDDAGTEYSASQAADLAAHIADTSDAHDASAISIVDAGTLYTATDVEAALAEVMTAVGAGGIPATIFDAQGDIIVASAADTAARLALGASGTVLRSNGTAPAWSVPAGAELDYVEFTSSVSISATTEATANTVVTSSSVSYDGSTAIMLEFFSVGIRGSTSAQSLLRLWLYDGSSSIGQICLIQNDSAATQFIPVVAKRRFTPSNAAHTYSIRGSIDTSTGSVGAGAGGAGTSFPGYIRITKV